MYTLVSKCKNDEVKGEKKNNTRRLKEFFVSYQNTMKGN
jgi:hypothetical protein